MTEESHNSGSSKTHPERVGAEGRGDGVRSVFGRRTPEPELLEAANPPSSDGDPDRRPLIDRRPTPQVTRTANDRPRRTADGLVEPTGDFRPIRSRAKRKGRGATPAERRSMARGLASGSDPRNPAAAEHPSRQRVIEAANGNGATSAPPETPPRLTGRITSDETTARLAAAPPPEGATARTTTPGADQDGATTSKGSAETTSSRASAPPKRKRVKPQESPYPNAAENAGRESKLDLDLYYDEIETLEEQLRHALAEVEFWRRGTLLAFFMAVGAGLVVFWPF